ncbi:unnamed protein product [Adineta steineri]|uniref:Uncharacterized protein n=1 Tax=Adineta steineri TaxID=433720 RepID=A0A813ZJH3_9BILA|nr:unnamed protein product [Adineta steineri]CAF0917920.1 unnamed protein product [Adineta steineri]CAF0928770.1 unnamed protein product [Adineta steineri]CAF0962286.1 unnamed protein product [Adineta steineri]CAF3529428.1 unnamed protein product [Adineta steineri]
MSEPPLPSARRQLLFAKYGPILITPFYFGFSTHVLTPSSFTRILGHQWNVPVVNSLWIGSHIGIGIYLYNSKHLRNANTFDRILYSIYGSAIFNLGTVLVMSIVRSIFPDSTPLRLGVGLSSSAAMLFIGRRYIQYIDQIFNEIRFRAITR